MNSDVHTFVSILRNKDYKLTLAVTLAVTPVEPNPPSPRTVSGSGSFDSTRIGMWMRSRIN